MSNLIGFNVSNIAKTTASLSVVEKGCSARKMGADFVTEAVKRAEAHLSTLLYKKDWKGIQVLIDEAGGESFPGSYNGTPLSTQVTIEFSGSVWFVKDVERSYVSKREVLIKNLYTKKDELVKFALERKAAA
jgi:hypothetical protein